jgi:putative flippase GtrA
MNRRGDSWRESGVRWLRFNAVGAMGVALQLATLALLTRVARWDYLGATAVAVEAALLHNFLWHERYTWADRTRNAHSLAEVLRRLIGFHAGNGAVSLAGNLLLMAWLTGALGVPPLAANIVSILVCSLVNFAIGDRLIFRARSAPDATALAGLATAYCLEVPGGAADLHARSFVGHTHEIALREGQKEQRGHGGEGETDADARPQQ